LEGLFAESGFRWLAMNVPGTAKALAALDDGLNRGSINPVKKWWWDIELDRASGRYVRAAQTHERGLQKDLVLRYEDQTLAVYPADKMPPPYPVPFPVNREEGITRYRALLTPAQYQARLAAGDTQELAPPTTPLTGEPPVFPVRLLRRQEMATGVAKFELAALDGGALPAFEAGAHIDVVIAPEYQRAYSLAGDPADRSCYVLGVLREDPAAGGRGGSALMHRAFREGRQLFIGKPVNHFPLHEGASHSLFFAGGIGVTPMLAMAHRLHTLGRPFDFHYSAAGRRTAGFLDELAQAPWAARVRLHMKDEGGRADLAVLVPAHQPGMQLYTCGAARYMDGLFAAAMARGWPEDALHREYFSVPEADAWVNQPFVLRLARSGRSLAVPADRSATDVLAAAGIAVDTKCSDGLCGVCATAYDADASAPVEHRDFVLSQHQRRQRIVLCCSRAQVAGGEIVLDL
ncbi:MAG: PDR/VanB family oxidoreductase, partial [Rubrivivax sp.]|nr:PDR/VanB family oxidoreductase [Rubrivivax sp.]